MIGVKGCPYCNGEVEVVRLNKKKGDTFQPYRVECLKCRRVAARSEGGFEIETPAKMKERIADYEVFIQHQLYPNKSNRIEQTQEAKVRDYIASKNGGKA